ncbi:hypothetical protein AAMO2058_000706400 [Amorphochlora amoebiformis]
MGKDKGNGGREGDAKTSGGQRESVDKPYCWWGEKASLPQCKKLPPEPQDGNIEYKLQLVDVTADKFQHLVTQCKWRLNEGDGTAFYQLGVEDDGNPEGLTDINLEKSINTIKSVAARLRCDAKIIRVAQGLRGKVAQVQVRHFRNVDVKHDVRICVVGKEGAGKSTLVGVLTSGELDDGKGLARMNVFRHRHEIEDGRTSSASVKLLGYDQKGRITNYQEFGGEEQNLVEVSDKVLTLIDLGGHERYLKTTVANLTGSRPDYACIVISANTGVQDMTKEHYSVIRALDIPCFMILSKTDISNNKKLEATIREIKELVQLPVISQDVNSTSSTSKPPEVLVVKSKVNPQQIIKQLADGMMIPVFPLSCVDGKGLGQLKNFLRSLPIQTPTKECTAGIMASLAIKDTPDLHVRPGMVLLDPFVKRVSVVVFDAEIWPVPGSVIHPNCELVIHMGPIRQAARLVSFESDGETVHTATYKPVKKEKQAENGGVGGTEDRSENKSPTFPRGRTRARFRFCLRPEYVKVNSRFVFRERRTKGIGQVISIEDLSESKGFKQAQLTQSAFLSKGVLIRQSSGETPLTSPVLEPRSGESEIARFSPFPNLSPKIKGHNQSLPAMSLEKKLSSEVSTNSSNSPETTPVRVARIANATSKPADNPNGGGVLVGISRFKQDVPQKVIRN